ncbi:MAG: ABC transporter ATP-binding protein [Methanoregulaceae archaeon]|nr:ABC transporter ATP-binding protein [Methanoregulaceae archaeon]
MTLEILNLSKEFPVPGQPPIQALSGITLTVGDKEFVSVLGPSGCGKTTLLRIVAGLETATSGSITLDGESIDRRSSQMAMIFQEYSLYPWRTIIDNVTFGLEMQNIEERPAREVALEYLHLVGLDEFANRYPYELSGGMRQRVAVARAMAIEPRILLMDEPFGALDAQTRNMLQKELLEIWEKTRKTVLFVTHSVDEAVYLSDRIVVLTARPGRIRKIVDSSLERPRNRTSPEFARIRRCVLDLINESGQPKEDLIVHPPSL